MTATEAGYKDITSTEAYTIVLTGWKAKPVEVITFDDSETGGIAGLSLH